MSMQSSGPPPEWVKAITDAQASEKPFLDIKNQIHAKLEEAWHLAYGLQQYVLDVEGDSDLHRKLQMYLVPNLNHWLRGAQAGNMKDLDELFARRMAQREKEMKEQSQRGDGHDVLTKPSA